MSTEQGARPERGLAGQPTAGPHPGRDGDDSSGNGSQAVVDHDPAVAYDHVPIGETAEHYSPGSARLEPHGPLWKAVDALVFVLVTGIVVTVAIQVVSRWMGASVTWTEELTRFLFIYTAFFGMAAGFRHAEHARIAFLIGKLPPAAQRASVHLYVVAGLLFFAVVAWKGWALTVQQYDSNERSAVLKVGMYVATLPVVLAAVLAIIAHVQSVYRSPKLRERLERGEMTSA
jgi:TRAP-type C4-dicarboxylate transport system permease small subunit